MSAYNEKSVKYSGGVKAFLSDWMIAILFVVLVPFAACFRRNSVPPRIS